MSRSRQEKDRTMSMLPPEFDPRKFARQFSHYVIEIKERERELGRFVAIADLIPAHTVGAFDDVNRTLEEMDHELGELYVRFYNDLERASYETFPADLAETNIAMFVKANGLAQPKIKREEK
jgi:hypothetical protein